MLRRRPLQGAAAAATAATAAATVTPVRGSSGQLWLTVCYGASTAVLSHPSGDSVTALRAPLESTRTANPPSGASTEASGCVVHYQTALRASRVLLAQRAAPPHGDGSVDPFSTLASTYAAHHSNNVDAREDQRGPYEVTIDEVLLHSHENHRSGTAVAVGTVADLVRLLVDPDVEVGGGAVETVSLRDFVAMTPKRKLKAVGGDAECLGVLLGSERYQSEKDARELRLRGVATVGQWGEQPDRVQLSAYSRGLLETAYNRLARHRHRSQSDEVVAWLSRAIQRVVADELMAPKLLPNGTAATTSSTPPFRMDLKASAVTAAGTAPADVEADRQAVSMAQQAATRTETERDDDSERPAAAAGPSGNSAPREAAGESTPARRRSPRQRPVLSHTAPKTVTVAAVEEDGVAESEELANIPGEDAEEVLEEALEEGEAVEDGEMAEAEAEAILGRDAAPAKSGAEAKSAKRAAALPSRQPSPAAEATPAGRHGGKRASEASAPVPRQQQHQPPPQQDMEDEIEAADADEDDEELIEEVEEEVEEVEEEEVEAAPSSPPTPAAATAPPATTAAGVTAAERRERLIRLAELMMKQFNTADGYLHPTSKAEREAQEQRGDILVLDEDTAQVDPLAMFSAYHAATITDADPVGVRALKTIWTSYNKHQMALEEATGDAAVEFYKRESVNALLYGSVLMRALAREEQVLVLEGTPLPPYGFPLVSSDTRPFAVFAAAGASSSSATAVTDMTSAKVAAATQAYKTFFASKEKRYSPFRPAIDQSAGCSVACLSGTTLHLYYTSTKDRIIEEEVRLPFAEVMLGVLHLLRHKVLPRVNVVHYHLIATKMADPSDSADFMLRSTATIDLTNPFSKEEVARLRALATPLGMADEMDEYRCIDDLVLDIEENSGASVVHSLLHNREDLEATLTATLAQLLPEDGDGAAGTAEAAEGAEVEEGELLEEEEEAEAAPPPPPPPRKARGAAAAPVPSPNPSRSGRRRAAQDEDEEEAGGGENDKAAEAAPARPSRGKHRQSPGTPLAPAAAAHAARDGGQQEEAVRGEAASNPWPQQPQRGLGGKPGVVVATAPKPTAVQQDSGDDDDASAEEEEDDFEEELEEDKEVEEEAELPPARAPARFPVPPASAASGAGTRTRGAGMAEAVPPASRAQRSSKAAPVAAPADDEEYEDDNVEEIEEAAGIEMAAAPAIPRATPGRRAVPVAVAPARPSPPPTPPAPAVRRAPQKVDNDEALQVHMRRGTRRSTARARAPPPTAHEVFEEAAVEDAPEAAVADADEDQWFKKRPKRRYFE
ncbi:hypothetical protein LSCM4_06626 [Leishmania orientalis]|uniref:Uncharacterized protein n=1 Tax=Leishmania orientalis TaxID=2249476 RepID=A0A836I069_9TRYP|nr:hypothetical protein LSCM4_06626 [Leishmania orientalis]